METKPLLIPLIITSIIVSALTAPILSIFLCLLLSLFISESKNKLIVFPLLFILSLNFAVIYSAKDFHGGATDFEIYYQFYRNILNGTSDNLIAMLFDNSIHFEPLYYLLNILISNVFGDLTEIQYSIILNLICIYGLCIATLIYTSNFNIKNILFVILISIFISKIGSITLFWRQSLSAIFIILFLSKNSKNSTKIACFFIAVGFHASSLFVAPLCYFILNSRLLKSKYYKIIFITLVILAIIWPIIGKNILLFMVSLFDLSKSSFFINDMDYPYFLDTLKTIIFTIPIVLFYGIQYMYKDKEPIYKILIFEILLLLTMATIPHSFRIIYPISVILIYVHTSLLLIKLNKPFFTISFLFIIAVNFLRLTSDELSYQIPLYSSVPFYYFQI